VSTFTYFPSANEQVAGHWVRFRVARCKNGHEERVRDTSANGLPPQALAKMFRAKGWEISSNFGGKVCPKCKADRPTKQQWKAIHAKRTEVSSHDNTVIRMPTAKVADDPRQPTRDDKRVIRDALDEHYDEKAERYTKNWSDKALAAKLNKPERWVADVREEFYGPDVNEAAAFYATEVAALRKRVDEVEASAMDHLAKQMEEIKAALKKLEVNASYAA
jgi:ribosome-binding protein aMBF1 (putative translation factor)